MTGVDYRNTSLHYNRGITLDKQYTRYHQKSDHLPVHMQQQYGRLALNDLSYKGLKSNNFKERGFLDPVSTLNTRKDFRVDPKKMRQLEQ